jgi:serine protease
MHQAALAFSVAEGGLATVVEFYNAAQDHYFITADTAEIALLDQGVMRGWTRTGETFKVMFGEAMQSSAKSVCRFYGLPSAGLDSHFFSASFDECVTVIDRWPRQWQLETTNAFGVVAEAPVTGCPGASQPLYRLYDNRPDVNHRYTTSTTTRDAMTARGWILEGSASPTAPGDRVAMCVPI